MLISQSAIASNIDELKIRDMDNDEIFPSYLVTPVKKDSLSTYKEAIFCPQVPGRGVCMSVPHYIQVKDGYEAGKIYKANAVESSGYSFSDILLAVGGGLLTGILIDQTLIRH